MTCLCGSPSIRDMGSVAVRPAVVAGKFYPSQAPILRRDLENYLGTGFESAEKVEGALGCVVPHAGYMFSGHVAGAVFRKLPARPTYLILCPNHTGRGTPISVMARGRWATPLGEIQIATHLAEALLAQSSAASEDSLAHVAEHSLEVQLPFLQQMQAEFSFVPIAVAVGDYPALASLGEAIGEAAKKTGETVLIIASSDMNHFEPDSVTRRKDTNAIERILALDPAGLYEVLHREKNTMCGFGPTIAMLTAAKQLGATKAELARYATSADHGGDRTSVVGYAGIIVS